MNANNRFSVNGSHVHLRGQPEARVMLASGNLIGAIKILREANAGTIGLKEAKDIVDRWRDEAQRPARAVDEISAVRRIYNALLSQPQENRARILSAATTLAEVTPSHLS